MNRSIYLCVTIALLGVPQRSYGQGLCMFTSVLSMVPSAITVLVNLHVYICSTYLCMVFLVRHIELSGSGDLTTLMLGNGLH